MEQNTKGGRPTLFSDAMAEEICLRLITRDYTGQLRTLRDVCKADDMPHEATVYRWLANSPMFSDMYARSREARAHMVAEEIIYIADTEEDPARARNRIDARKWWAGKANAKHYGERTQTDINQTVTINVAFEDFVRSLTGATEPKVINGTVAREDQDMAREPLSLRP